MIEWLELATLSLFALLLLATIVRGAPFVPSSSRNVEKMLALAKAKPGEKAADLGSGDGKIVIALARAGVQAHGYEINPLLVWWSRRNIRKAELSDKAFIHWKDFWRADLREYDVVILFGTNRIMRGFEKKLKKELQPGARVVSNIFRLPTWLDVAHDGSVFLYVR